METIIHIAAVFWTTLAEMAPYLLFGFGVAGALSVFISPEFVERHLGGHGIWPVFKASLLGVPLPLCSCGVIPVAASLRKHGSSKGATAAFLLSTPQTGVDSIMATLSLLGPVYAVFRPVAAFLTGLIGGSVVEVFGGGEPDKNAEDECRDTCCAGKPGSQSKLRRMLNHGFVVLPRDIAGPLMVGLVVAGLIAVAVPENFFSEQVGTGFGAMLIMMALGIPLYVCATASIPIAAAMILEQGISPGAALVFLMTGPATNAATIATVWRMLGRRTALIYLVVVALTALASGLALDYLFEAGNLAVGRAEGRMLPHAVKNAAAVVLLAVLGLALFRKPSKQSAGSTKEPEDAEKRSCDCERQAAARNQG